MKPENDSSLVPVEILPPLPQEERSGDTRAQASKSHQEAMVSPTVASSLKTFYHPVSGVIILGIDFIGFGSEFLTGFLTLVPICILSFFITFVGVLIVQLKVGKDKTAGAVGKAFLGAVLAGMPFFIGPTILGAAVLMLSGLPQRKDLVKEMVMPSKNKK